MTESLRLIFAGTPEFAARHLRALADHGADSGHEIVAVYTQPDRASGRGRRTVPSPVKAVAQSLDLPIFQPDSLRDPDAVEQLASFHADLMVVVAYGLILPRTVLDTPRYGCVNVHASLLPRWRGAAPVERALLAGDRETGVTIMQMDAGLDTGDMLLTARTAIEPDDTRETLQERLTGLGCQALLETLDRYTELREHAQPQDDTLSTYAAKLRKEEALIDWNEPAAGIDRRVRAGIGRLPATVFLDDLRIRLLGSAISPLINDTGAAPGTILAASREGLDVACGEGVVRITHVQLPGRKPASVQDILNARRALFEPGRCFLPPPVH